MTRLATPAGTPASVSRSIEQDRGARGQLAGLEDEGAARGDRRGDLPGGLQQRVVPRRDERAHADRLGHHAADHVGAARSRRHVRRSRRRGCRSGGTPPTTSSTSYSLSTRRLPVSRLSAARDRVLVALEQVRDAVRGSGRAPAARTCSTRRRRTRPGPRRPRPRRPRPRPRRRRARATRRRGIGSHASGCSRIAPIPPGRRCLPPWPHPSVPVRHRRLVAITRWSDRYRLVQRGSGAGPVPPRRVSRAAGPRIRSAATLRSTWVVPPAMLRHRVTRASWTAAGPSPAAEQHVLAQQVERPARRSPGAAWTPTSLSTLDSGPGPCAGERPQRAAQARAPWLIAGVGHGRRRRASAAELAGRRAPPARAQGALDADAEGAVAHRDPLVGQGRAGQRPAAVDLAHDAVVGDEDAARGRPR